MSTSSRLALGVDIGGTSTKLGLVSAEGVITAPRKIVTDALGDDPTPFLARLDAAIESLWDHAGQELAGIGVSTHGEVDPARRGPIIAGNTPALRNFDLRGHLEARFGCRVVLNNDLTAHTLGEYHFGCGRGVGRFMCMAMGTGLGAGVIVDGRPLIIDGGNSGNTGLVVLDPHGPLDNNGIRGSAEALCGVRGIERLARERYGHAVTARDVIDAARIGDDPVAGAIMRQVGEYLGHTLAILSVIFYPQRIAITGGTTAAGDVLLQATRDTFEVLVGGFFRDIAAHTGGHFHEAEIVLGERGSEAGLLGSTIELFA
ncbi:MAG: ROK family protein [Anaerolineae bacterium]|nr:ROK family protein [Anaerolineae bacterium]